jgi:glycosyltransferase involved in cell wall biosynthesis
MIKYILSHPIQYQSPLLKYLSKRIKIKVIYRSDISLKKHFDSGFNKNVLIDKNLLNGYSYDFLKYVGTNKVTKIHPINTEFKNKIFSKETKIVWMHGIKIWYNFIIILLCKLYNKKVIVRDELNLLKKRSYFNILINKFYFRFINHFIDAFLYIGKRNREFYITNQIPKEKLFLVPYVIDNKKFELKGKKNIKKKLQIYFIGKLIHRKGCDILLKAINKCNNLNKFKKNVEIKIIGDGILFNKYINYKKKNKLSNVFFLGFKNQDEIKKHIKKSNIFVIPSREENWGLVVNEAMNAGNVIIASDLVGSSADLVKNNFNGYTFKNEDYKDLSYKLLKLINNKKKLNIFSKNSIKIIRNWGFNECLIGLQKAIKYVSKK